MEKLVERFSIEEILSLLAPGFAALVGLRALLGLEIADVLGPSLSRDSLPVTVTALIAAYGVGLFLLEWVNAGTRFFMNLHLEHLAHIANPSVLRRSVWRRVIRFPVWLLHGMPLPRMRRSFVEAQVMMCEFNESASHTFEGSRISSPWDRLDLFRKLVPGTSSQGAAWVLNAATGVHSRLLFVLSLSLVLALTAMGSAFRCAFAIAHHQHLGGPIMVVATSGLASYFLRGIAARYWEMEIMLVCSLAEWRRP